MDQRTARPATVPAQPALISFLRRTALSAKLTPIYQGRIVTLGIEQVDLPGGPTLMLEIVRHPGGAGSLALDGRGCVCLVRQYRHAAGGWIWEIPAGKLDPGEEPLTTAQRELEEEAGLRAASWVSLGSMLSTPGFCDELLHMFLARDLTTVPANTEEHELIEVHWVSFEQALNWAYSGEIRDAKTLVAIFRAARALGRPD
jgi:ADP-ribose pyrophosphatase